jgi:hypothetical protein
LLLSVVGYFNIVFAKPRTTAHYGDERNKSDPSGGKACEL